MVIQAPRALRKRIAATVHQAWEQDHHGCPVRHPLGVDRALRPQPVDVTTLTGVESVAGCRYDLADYDEGGDGDGVNLVSSVRVTGPAVQRSIRAIADAPLGGGPDRPGSCIRSSVLGDEAIVLRVERPGAGPAEILLRYAGCERNGFDDGVAVRALTRDAVRPFVEGPNQPLQFNGGVEKLEILEPESVNPAVRKKFRIDERAEQVDPDEG